MKNVTYVGISLKRGFECAVNDLLRFSVSSIEDMRKFSMWKLVKKKIIEAQNYIYEFRFFQMLQVEKMCFHGFDEVRVGYEK